MTTEVLLAGFGGAFAVFVLGAFREWWREEREREGLLRLLLAEVEHNTEVVRTIGETTDDLLGSDDFPSLTTETWRALQGRAAALLPDELSVALNGYYARLQTLLTLRDFEKRDDERLKRAWAQTHSELFGMEFAGARNPWSEYLDAMLEAQDAAREQIIGYLALPWDARLLLRVVRWLERLGGACGAARTSNPEARTKKRESGRNPTPFRRSRPSEEDSTRKHPRRRHPQSTAPSSTRPGE